MGSVLPFISSNSNCEFHFWSMFHSYLGLFQLNESGTVRERHAKIVCNTIVKHTRKFVPCTSSISCLCFLFSSAISDSCFCFSSSISFWCSLPISSSCFCMSMSFTLDSLENKMCERPTQSFYIKVQIFFTFHVNI